MVENSEKSEATGWTAKAALQWLVAHSLPIGAAASLLAALWLAFQDKPGAAGIPAALFVVAVLFFYFPLLESFKAFSVEAKLREGISQAKDILDKVREASIVAAQHNLYNIALGDRMASQRWSDKFRMRKATINHLVKIGTEVNKVNEMIQLLIKTMAYDIYNHCRAVMAMRVASVWMDHINRIDTLESNANAGDNSHKDELAQLQAERNSLMEYGKTRSSQWNEIQASNVRQLLDADIARVPLPEADRDRLRSYVDRTCSATLPVASTRDFNPEIGVLMDRITDSEAPNDIYRELFGEEPHGTNR